ncbi:MAG: toll/interleukin-1 receptor domain-containing protein [Promethearchaeota archaeon]
MKRNSMIIQVVIMLISMFSLNLYFFNTLFIISEDISNNSADKSFKLSSTTLWAHNYDDENQEDNAYVHYDSSSDFQYLIVEFPIPSGKFSIVKGVQFKYRCDGSGPYNLVVSYFSDDFNNETTQWWADSTIYNLPYTSTPSWHTNYYYGPVYAIDDTPAIMFSSDQPRSDCVLISGDTPNIGYSYFYDETGIFIENRYEWIVDIMYEEITNLTEITSATGDISGNDYLDAYFLFMEAGANYSINLNRNTGTGTLNMRLVEFEPLTITNIINNTGIIYPKYLNFTPSTTNNYILLIEPNQHGIDSAQYTITVEEIIEETNGEDLDDDTPSGGDGRMLPIDIIYLIIIISIVSILTIGGLFLIKRKYFGKPKTSIESALPTTLIGVPKKLFMSYSTFDTEHFQISKIVEELKNYPEVEEVLYWEEDSGSNIVEYMEETLKKCNIFLLFCSENSMKSKAVKDEWQAAFQLRKLDLIKIIPIYENQDNIPRLLLHLLNVKFTPDDFNGFIEKLYIEILRM